MDILCALEQKKMAEPLTFVLESKFQAHVTYVPNTAEAIDFVIKGNKIDLIVTDHPGTAEPLSKFLQAMKPDMQFIVIAQKEEKKIGELKNQKIVFGPDYLDAFVGHVTKIQQALGGGEVINDSEFCRIAVSLLAEIGNLKVDVFIKLGTSKYVKLFAAGTKFEAADQKKLLVEKKIEYLFVKKENADILIKGFQASLDKALSNPNLTQKEFQDLSVTSHDIAREMITKTGATPEVRTMIKSNIMGTVKCMGNNPKLRNILAQLTLDKGSYISSHSTLLAQLACSIASGLEWGSATTFHKLTMAAFLHDIVLKDQELARIQTKKQLQTVAQKYKKEQLNEFLLHPATAAELSRKFEEVPPDVDAIIAQHHELPDGSGFPRGLTGKQMSPLSAVFIIAHELLTQIFESDGKFVMADFIESTKDKYSAGNFRKVHQALKDMKL